MGSTADFNLLSLLFILSVLAMTYHEGFLFWSCLFDVLCAACIYVDVSFLRLAKFSSMI